MHQILDAGMPESDAHAPIVVADMCSDGAQAVVPGNPASGLHAHFARRKIDLVMKCHNVRNSQLVKMSCFRDRSPRLVHVSARKQEKDARSSKEAFCGYTLKAPAPGR